MKTIKAPPISVPIKLVEQLNEINSWIGSPHNATVRAYQAQSEVGDEWKFEVVDTSTGEVLCKHLQTQYADGHTICMFLDAMRKQKEKGYAEGLANAAKRVYEVVCERFGIRPELITPVRKD